MTIKINGNFLCDIDFVSTSKERYAEKQKKYQRNFTVVNAWDNTGNLIRKNASSLYASSKEGHETKR